MYRGVGVNLSYQDELDPCVLSVGQQAVSGAVGASEEGAMNMLTSTSQMPFS